MKGGDIHSINRPNSNIFIKNSKRRCFNKSKKLNQLEIGSKKYNLYSIRRNNLLPKLKECGYNEKPFGLTRKYRLANKKFNNSESVNITNSNTIFKKKSKTKKVRFNNNTTGKTNTGRNNTGRNNTGKNNTGRNNTGRNNTGRNNTGINNTGRNNTGRNNTGRNNTEIILAENFQTDPNKLNYPCWDNMNCWISHPLVCLLVDPHQSILDALFNSDLSIGDSKDCNKTIKQDLREELLEILHNLHFKQLDKTRGDINYERERKKPRNLYTINKFRDVLRGCNFRDIGYQDIEKTGAADDFILNLFKLFPLESADASAKPKVRPETGHIKLNINSIYSNSVDGNDCRNEVISNKTDTLAIIYYTKNKLSTLIQEEYFTPEIYDAFTYEKTEQEWQKLKIKHGKKITKQFKSKEDFNAAIYREEEKCLPFIGYECETDKKKYRFHIKNKDFILDKKPLIITLSRAVLGNPRAINQTEIVPDEELTYPNKDGSEVKFILKSIIKPEPYHYTCFFNSQGNWYYYNDLKLCKYEEDMKSDRFKKIGKYKGMNSAGFRHIGRYSELLKDRDSKLGCIYIYYPSDS